MDKEVLNIAKLAAEDTESLVWADQKICEVPHIAIRQLEAVVEWADIVTVMEFAWCDELQQKANKLDVAILLVNELYTNGNRFWKYEGELKITPNVLGKIGSRYGNLLHVRAGVASKICDLPEIIVRGRSLYDN